MKLMPKFLTTRKDIITVLRQEKWLVGDDPLYLKFRAIIVLMSIVNTLVSRRHYYGTQVMEMAL